MADIPEWSVVSLLQRVDELEEVLRPFAVIAGGFAESLPGEAQALVVSKQALRVRDFREARRVLARLHKK